MKNKIYFFLYFVCVSLSSCGGSSTSKSNAGGLEDEDNSDQVEVFKSFSVTGLYGCVTLIAKEDSANLCSENGAYNDDGELEFSYNENEELDFLLSITNKPDIQECVFDNGEASIIYRDTNDELNITCTDVLPAARSYLARNNYGARLEPQDQISHCLGSTSANTLSTYSQLMPEGQQPAVFIDFIDLANVNENTLTRLQRLLAEYREAGNYIAAQIGLNFTYHPYPTTHYDAEVANGDYDEQIHMLAEMLAELSHPVYLRVGFEFNGWEWMGYEPESYKAAFIRITNIVREYSDEIATVWHAVSEGITENPNSIYDYYPGDEYVDWWGLSMFNPDQFVHPSVTRFFEEAHTAGKPVMIAESTAKGIGVDDGLQDWNTWFEPYFNTIANQPGVKALCYINWDWENRLEIWNDWGNAQIQDNRAIETYFKAELSNSIFLHGDSEKSMRLNLLGLADRAAPEAVSDFELSEESSTLDFSWVDSQPEVRRYDVYLNNILMASTSANSLSLNKRFMRAGTDYEASVIAVDRIGNKSARSDSIAFALTSSLEKIENGDFEEGSAPWKIDKYGAGDMVLSIETETPISGAASGKITITEDANESWHLQFGQLVSTNEGADYRIRYSLRANRDTSFFVGLQQTEGPYEFLFTEQHTLSAGVPVDVDFTVTESITNFRNFVFVLGYASSGTEIIIDNVSVVESFQ